jgi:hypothetical protein
MHEFYASHSSITDPGRYAHLLDDLPRDLAGIARVVQGLVYHYTTGQHFFGYCPPPERMPEIDTRYTEAILARLMEMNSRPLTEARAYEHRLVGCCRDFSLLACAILRQQGVPARLRIGFAGYFEAGYWGDHVIVEVWEGARWRRFDPQVAGWYDAPFDLLDMPEAAFATAGRAWQMCRTEGADPARFGLGAALPELAGLGFIHGSLQLDLAALNKAEMLQWDVWGGALLDSAPNTEAENALLDEAAAASLQPDGAAARALWANEPRLRAPELVTCYSPAQGTHLVRVG